MFLGSIPQELSKLTRLEKVCVPRGSLSQHHLSGEFPLEVARLPFLRIIDIDGQSFSSNISKRMKLLIF